MARRNTGPELIWLKERNCYYIRWYEKRKPRKRSTGTQDLREAQEILAEFIGYNKIATATAESITPTDMLIDTVLTYYAEHHAPTVADPTRLIHAAEALLTYWAGKHLSEITTATCRQYARSRGMAPGTIRRELGVLVAAQNFLIRERKLAAPVHVPLPDKPDPKDRWLTISEAARFLNAARHGGRNSRDYLPLFVMLALYTGARVEAILSLTWDRVDLEAGLVDYRVPGRRRTKKRRVQVPIPRQLMTFLKFAHAKRPAEFDRLPDGGPVIHNEGKPLERIIRGVKAAAKRAGLEDVTPHVLRHTCGTWMAQNGAELWEIAGFLGQDSATTEKYYAHHHPNFMKKAKAAVERTNRAAA